MLLHKSKLVQGNCQQNIWASQPPLRPHMKTPEFCVAGIPLGQVVGTSTTKWTCFPAWMIWTMMWASWMQRSWKCCCPDDSPLVSLLGTLTGPHWVIKNLPTLSTWSPQASEYLNAPQPKGACAMPCVVVARAELGCCRGVQETPERITGDTC